jgi:hypothetical protein
MCCDRNGECFIELLVRIMARSPSKFHRAYFTDAASSALLVAQRKSLRMRCTIVLLEEILRERRCCSLQLLRIAKVNCEILRSDCEMYASIIRSKQEPRCLRHAVEQAFRCAQARADANIQIDNNLWIDTADLLAGIATSPGSLAVHILMGRDISCSRLTELSLREAQCHAVVMPKLDNGAPRSRKWSSLLRFVASPGSFRALESCELDA